MYLGVHTPLDVGVSVGIALILIVIFLGERKGCAERKGNGDRGVGVSHYQSKYSIISPSSVSPIKVK